MSLSADINSAVVGLPKRLRSLNLVQQFVLAGSIVVIIAMTVIGRWVASQIETGVVHSTSAATVLYMESVLAPLVPTLVARTSPPSVIDKRIKELFRGKAVKQNIVSIKIWQRDGQIIYSNREELIGRRFEPTANLEKAWSGIVSVELDSLVDEEDVFERAMGLRLLEMYMPVRAQDSGEIIAVAEFYLLANDMVADLATAQVRSWLLVGVVTLAMMAALFRIVQSGHRTIERQGGALKTQIGTLTGLLDENRLLSGNLARARRRAGTINERFLRRVGADLHDGPAQLIGYALLRLDTLRPGAVSDDEQLELVDAVQASLREALSDIRRQSGGLALPELDQATVIDAVELAVGRHESHTKTNVDRDFQADEIDLPNEAIVCIYRFIQEGLNNCYRHAQAIEQRITTRGNGSQIVIEITDRGPGVQRDLPPTDEKGIGLIALRDRVEALNGQFSFGPREGGGTRLWIRLGHQKMGQADA
ncbi:MAG: sensor histidine kinase [Hyphomicrobiaceae bacterium]